MKKYKVYATVTFNLEYEIEAENEDKSFEIADNLLQEWVEKDNSSLEDHNVKTEYDVTDVTDVTELDEEFECSCQKLGYAPCQDCY